MLAFIRNHFKSLFWGSAIWLFLYGVTFLFITMRWPELVQSVAVFFSGITVAFVPVVMASLLVIVAVIQACKQERTWFSAFGYLVMSLLLDIYFIVFFLFASVAAFGFS